MAGEHGWLPELFTADVWPRLGAQFGLTLRQIDVARLMCRGLPNKQIATELGRSVNTVAMHQRMLFRAWGAGDRRRSSDAMGSGVPPGRSRLALGFPLARE